MITTLTQIYSEETQTGQREIQNVQFEEKKSIDKFKAGAKACVERDKGERSDTSGVKGG